MSAVEVPQHSRMLLTGNHAVAYAALLARPQVIPVYPITPQTPILEKLLELADRGELAGELITVESEHSAMAACIAASLAGARVFTATASQGRRRWRESRTVDAGRPERSNVAPRQTSERRSSLVTPGSS